MRACDVVLCAVLAFASLGPALAEDTGFYVGVESRLQRAELSVEKALETDVFDPSVVQDLAPFIDEAEVRSPIMAFRFGYVAELATDFYLDVGLTLGTVYSSVEMEGVDPSGPGDERIHVNNTKRYLGVGAGVAGSAGALSYTGGFRYETFQVNDVTEQRPAGLTRSSIEQKLFAIEGTVGRTAGDMRYYVGIGYHACKAEANVKDWDSALIAYSTRIPSYRDSRHAQAGFSEQLAESSTCAAALAQNT